MCPGTKTGGPSPTQLEFILLHDQIIDCIGVLKNKHHFDPILLREKYVVEGLSLAQISKEFFFSKATIRNALKRFGIPLRGQHRHHGWRSKRTYGFKIENKRSVQDVAEQKVIRSIIELRETEHFSFHKIAKYLNKIGVPTKTKSKDGWHREVVRSIYYSNIGKP